MNLCELKEYVEKEEDFFPPHPYACFSKRNQE
jgi:hypothetical protein